MSTPGGTPIGITQIRVVGGENLYRIAELFLGDATQWWRIAELNGFPGVPSDFVISTSWAQQLAGVLQIPAPKQGATWP